MSSGRQHGVSCISVLDQILVALRPHNRLASAIGALVGGFIPVASFVVAHMEVRSDPAKWVLVAAGMAYSALTVFQWGRVAFKHPAKALGFVVLVEGVAIFSATLALALGGLAILVAINAVATAFNLVADRRESRATNAAGAQMTRKRKRIGRGRSPREQATRPVRALPSAQPAFA